ncbi:hypothetical protein KP509_22G035700 [Ceratopteris richardii]|uniref:Uncharacterized protein n=1 Tax=Ceratopteris richardii TaxID=49495 RepID=A0A8T2S766_CERRI|nr:hypothetical protein KP509_22G035700 [Ceratopteris richardii]
MVVLQKKSTGAGGHRAVSFRVLFLFCSSTILVVVRKLTCCGALPCVLYNYPRSSRFSICTFHCASCSSIKDTYSKQFEESG